jgi:hypothetical protein
LFVDGAGSQPAGGDGIYGSADDGLRLTSASACIAAGTITGAPAQDFLGVEYTDGLIDIGAYKYISIIGGNCQFGKLNANGEFSESTIGIIHNLKFEKDIRIFAGSNTAFVARIFIDKDKRLRKKHSIELFVRGLDETKSAIPRAIDIPVVFYKVGEQSGKYIFQSKTATEGKDMLFAWGSRCQGSSNPYAYVICTRSLNFVITVK